VSAVCITVIAVFTATTKLSLPTEVPGIQFLSYWINNNYIKLAFWYNLCDGKVRHATHQCNSVTSSLSRSLSRERTLEKWHQCGH